MWYIRILKEVDGNRENAVYMQVAVSDYEVERSKVDVLKLAFEQVLMAIQEKLKEENK
jgi:hypothetical protein